MTQDYGNAGPVTVHMEGPFSGGGNSGKVGTITLNPSAWKGSGPYSQTVNVDFVSANSILDPQPSDADLEMLCKKGIAMVVQNNGGVVTIHAIGGKPDWVMSVQTEIRDVVRVSEGSSGMGLWGNCVGAAMRHVLFLSGGKMTGGINMGNNTLEGVKIPESNDQASNRKYVDDSVKVATAAAAGAQATADTAVSAAKNADSKASDAAKDAQNAKSTADSKALRKSFEILVPKSGWTGDTAPYSQTVTVDGILAEDKPYYGPVYSGDLNLKHYQKSAFASIDDLQTADGAVTFSCFDSKPDVDLVIQMEVFR